MGLKSDLYNSEIVASGTHRRNILPMATSMLNRVFRRLAPSCTSLLPSDHGWLYRVPEYARRLARKSVQAKHVAQGQLPGQCGNGEFFWNTRIGTVHLNRFNSIAQLSKALTAISATTIMGASSSVWLV